MTKREMLESIKEQIKERIEDLNNSEPLEGTTPLKGDLVDRANALVNAGQNFHYLIGIYKRDLYVLSQIPDERKDTVEAGSLVRFEVNGEELTRLFVPLQNIYEVGEIKTASTNSPLFKRIKGAKKGSVIEYKIDGREFVVKILEIQ